MTTSELQITIGSGLSLIVLVLVTFKLWPNQRVDMFRQNMFALRDELFDFAADGNVAFEEPAYILLRQLMNGFIRYAHNLTPYRILMSYLRSNCVRREPISEWTSDFNRALGDLSEQNREKLQSFHSRAAAMVLSQLVLSPGLLLTLALPVLLLAIFSSQWTNLRAIYNSVNDRFPMSFLEGEAAKS